MTLPYTRLGNRLQQNLIQKRNPRKLFQVVGKLKLDKYDFKNNEFPFVDKIIETSQVRIVVGVE